MKIDELRRVEGGRKLFRYFSSPRLSARPPSHGPIYLNAALIANDKRRRLLSSPFSARDHLFRTLWMGFSLGQDLNPHHFNELPLSIASSYSSHSKAADNFIFSF